MSHILLNIYRGEPFDFVLTYVQEDRVTPVDLTDKTVELIFSDDYKIPILTLTNEDLTIDIETGRIYVHLMDEDTGKFLIGDADLRMKVDGKTAMWGLIYVR